MRNPWLNLQEDAEEYILHEDIAACERFRKGRCHSEDLELRLELLPQPFIGNPTAPIIFLCANPGYSEGDLHDFGQQPQRDLLFKCIRREAVDFPFYYLHPEVTGNGSQWWRKRIKNLMQELGCTTDRSRQRLSHLICAHEFFPYHSRRFAHQSIHSVSLGYQSHCIRQAINNDSIIVGMRSRRHWIEVIPELDDPRKNQNIYWSRNPRAAFITEGNLGSAFPKIIEKLDRMMHG